MKYMADENVIRITKSASAAIIFDYIAYFVDDTKSRREAWKYHDGQYWIYNTLASWCDHFKCFSERAIRTALKRLEDAGLIMTGHFEKARMRNATWYTLTDAGWAIINEQQRGRENKACPQQSAEPSEVELEDALFVSAAANDAWNAFVKMRKEKGLALTEAGKKMTLEQLEKLAPNNESKKTEILKQSVRRSWKDVYPLPSAVEKPTDPTDNPQYYWPDLPNENEVANNDEC